MEEERPIIICTQVVKMHGVTTKDATVEKCSQCREPVWLGKATPRPAGYRIFCFDCAAAEARKPGASPVKVHPLTEDQRETIAEDIGASDSRISELAQELEDRLLGGSYGVPRVD